MNVTRFERVTNQPLLDLSAVPWAQPAQVVKGDTTPESEREVRATIMHPSIVEAGRFSRQAPARYLMYYAPHHSPGIGAAASEQITGPWEPLPENPVLRLDRFDGIKGHLSGPDVIWVDEERRFRMYFHGSVPGAGQQTGLAVSTDGVRFEPYSPDPILPHPYLRVFRPDKTYYGVARYGNDLGLVRSPDGIEWAEWPKGCLLKCTEGEGEHDRLRHHCVWMADDVLHLYYCTYRDAGLGVEAIRLATMSLEGDWGDWGAPERQGDVLEPQLEWEAGNLRDPYVIEADGRLYMFYVGGNEAGIGLARAVR